MSVALDTITPIGATPAGKRAFMSFKGGSFSGPFGSGTVAVSSLSMLSSQSHVTYPMKPGGQAEVITYPDLTDNLVTSYLLQTNDSPSAFITLKSKGFRSGPPEVLHALQNPQTAAGVDPNTFKSRLIITMQTGDERYKEKVNYGFWIGSGLKIGMEVVYEYVSSLSRKRSCEKSRLK